MTDDSKTPEQMAEEYASKIYRLKYYVDGRRKYNQGQEGLRWLASKNGFLAGYQAAKDEWISVKERLPEMNVVVLVFSKLTYLNVAHRVVDDEGWCWATVSMSIAPYEITHWMPLPEAPKGEK